MKTKSIEIRNRKNQSLATKIDFQNHRQHQKFALFAHCFTCTSQLNAVRNISTALSNRGISVARFDFTGLGNSEGDFANSHFEANVEDLLDVNAYLSDHFQAPELIVGHSLGGSAAIVAAAKLKNIKAVATIGAPADIQHTLKHFSGQVKDLKMGDSSEVIISGRKFTISWDFVEGFKRHNLSETIKSLRKPILILHSPFDEIVGIENAHEIYHNALHPKSFVSLDKANHLLTNKEDSLYAGQIIASWADRYINLTTWDSTRQPKN